MAWVAGSGLAPVRQASICAPFGFVRSQDGGAGQRLGLQGLEGPQRAPQLGHGRAAVAQQGVERARTVAIAHQPQAEPVGLPAALAALIEQLALDPIGALEPPGRDGEALGEHALQRPLGRQVALQPLGQRRELPGVLVVDQDEGLGAKPVLEGVAGRARLAGRAGGPTRLGAVATAGRSPRGREVHAHGAVLDDAGGLRAANGPAPTVYAIIGIFSSNRRRTTVVRWLHTARPS